MLWDTLDTNNFYFILFYFSDFILILFSFSFFFGWWKDMWYHSHMIGHMMWHHRPRMWEKDLEDDVSAHVYNMVALSKRMKWTWVLRLLTMDFIFSLFTLFLFYFILFSIFRTTQVRVYQSRCHISHKTDHET